MHVPYKASTRYDQTFNTFLENKTKSSLPTTTKLQLEIAEVKITGKQQHFFNVTNRAGELAKVFFLCVYIFTYILIVKINIEIFH